MDESIKCPNCDEQMRESLEANVYICDHCGYTEAIMSDEQTSIQDQIDLHLLDAINDPARLQVATKILEEEGAKFFYAVGFRLSEEGFTNEEVLGFINSAFGFVAKDELLDVLKLKEVDE